MPVKSDDPKLRIRPLFQRAAATRLYRITPIVNRSLPVILVLLLNLNAYGFASPRKEFGPVHAPQITEASGLAASRINDGILWTHNDSGDRNRIFAIDKTGTLRAVFYLAGIRNRDWEDIAVGPGPIEGRSYLYIGDIGDNRARYEWKHIYRVPEPVIDEQKVPSEASLTGIKTITFRYPDGNRDAETLMVDPLTGDIFIVSKREMLVHVYRLPFPQSTDTALMAQKVGKLDIPLATGGDISPNGKHIVIRNYEDLYYWRRKPGKTVAQTLKKKPLILRYKKEPMGEAVAWDSESRGYFTISEGEHLRLYYYLLHRKSDQK